MTKYLFIKIYKYLNNLINKIKLSQYIFKK